MHAHNLRNIRRGFCTLVHSLQRLVCTWGKPDGEEPHGYVLYGEEPHRYVLYGEPHGYVLYGEPHRYVLYGEPHVIKL